MRIETILTFALLTAGMACSRNNVVIEGHIEDGDGTRITFEKLDVNRTVAVDSLEIKKGGDFLFRTHLDEPELYILKNDQGEILNLMLFPGDRVSVNTTTDSFGTGYEVEGSEESENIRLLVEHLTRTRIALDSLELLADSINDPTHPQMDLIRTAYAQSIIQQKRFIIKYLVQHMTSLSSIYALYQKYDDQAMVLSEEADLQYFKVLADSLESAYPNSSLTKSLRADIESRQFQYQETIQMNELLRLADEESGMLDLTIPDRDGKEIKLSSFKGKVVLLVFWASGNRESVNSLLQLQSTYSRYKSQGFEVFAISLDNNKIEWMNSIDFNEFNWINVSELSYPESKAGMLYNVTALPSSFLINRDGDIMAKNLYGRTLETWLDNLL